jgi:uncharacterized protein (TIGR03435 family)
MKRLALLLVLGMAAIPAVAQTTPQKPVFEVASVKENTNNGPSDMQVPRRSGDLIIMHNTRLFALINYAYRLTASYQMEGYDRFDEGWKWYDIQAKVPSGAADDEVRLMFQSLLADRFKVRVHRETKEIPQFEFVTDRGKSKLTSSSSEELMKVAIEGRIFTQPRGVCSGFIMRERHMMCHAANINTIAAYVSGLMRAPVVDRTGLTGTYDLHIVYIADERKLEPNAPAVASLEQELQEELGLKLQKGKGPAEVIVIDHMEKPSEN